MGQAPKEVKEGSQLEFLLQRRNCQFLQHDQRLLASRTNRLTNEGFFRHLVQAPRTKGWRREGDLRWSPEMHRVERIDRELVVDEEGRSYPIKEVLPVPEGSTELQLVGRGLRMAGQAKRDALGGARAELENVLKGLGG